MRNFRIAPLTLLALVSLGSCVKKTSSSNSGAETFSGSRNALSCGEPGDMNRPNSTHCEGPFFVAGPWEFSRPDMEKAYKNEKKEPVPLSRFGTIELKLPNGSSVKSSVTGRPKVFRDLHYQLGGGRVGLRPIPVTNDPIKTADGVLVNGSEHLDKIMRIEQGFGEQNLDAPLFALGLYLYPREWKTSLYDVAKVRLNSGVGHMAVYVGKSETLHSPVGNHDRWQAASNEPTTLVTVTLDGVKQEIVNRQLIGMSRILNVLNGGPVFPKSYIADPMRTYDLKTILELYAVWIEGGDALTKIRNSRTWDMYCAEWVQIVTNVALNVPQNEFWYKKVWGEKRGGDLWKRVKERWNAEIKNGGAFPEISQGAMNPLWVQDKVDKPASLVEPGRALAWMPETSANTIASFLEQYLPWPDVGPAYASFGIFGFMPELVKRMGITAEKFTEQALPAHVLIFKHHASTQSIKSQPDLEDYLTKQLQDLADELELAGAPVAFSNPILDAIRQGVLAQKDWIIKNSGTKAEKAWDNFRTEGRAVLMQACGVKAACDLDTGEATGNIYIEYYTPPALVQRIIQNIYPKNSHVGFKVIGTVFWAPHLRQASKAEGSEIQ